MTASNDLFAYDRARHEASVEEWRRGRLARLTAADGWLSLIGRVPLEQGSCTVGAAESCDVVLPAGKAPDAVGVFERAGSDVAFTPAHGVNVTLHRGGGVEVLKSGVAINVRTDRDGAADKLELGELKMEIADLESGMFVRVRDPNSATRLEFPGIEHYSIDPKWRVVAKLERYEPLKAVDLSYEGSSTQHYLSPGAAVFEIDGVSYRVDPVIDGDRGRLYLLFWDQTGRDTTYGAGRFLYASLPEGDRVLLDFNQAFSPPCAFTPYSACPLAPAQNRLALRVEAGEKSPH